MQYKKLIIALPIILLLLNIADIVSTYIGLTYFGLIETNLIYGNFVIIIKMVLCLFLIGTFYKAHGKLLIPLTSFTITLNFIYVYTIINNITLIMVK